MRKMLLLVSAAGLLSLAAAQGVSAGNGAVNCGSPDPYSPDAYFTGTAKDLNVPAGYWCFLEGATISHDATVQPGGSLEADNSTIGHDVTANGAAVIYFFNYTGPNKVGHDFVATGTSPATMEYGGWDVCGTTIGHDLSITGANVAYEIEIGDQGPQDNEFCGGLSPDTIGHDLVVSGNHAGHIDVGNNSVAHDLAVSNNTTYDYDSGDPNAAAGIGVDDNTVSHDATCVGNSPALSKDGPEDGPNHVGHNDTGCG